MDKRSRAALKDRYFEATIPRVPRAPWRLELDYAVLEVHDQLHEEEVLSDEVDRELERAVSRYLEARQGSWTTADS